MLGEALMEAVGQLSLALFPGEPWEGRSPRGLTRVGMGVILKPQGVRARVPFLDPLQVDVFPRRSRERLKPKSRTAPTLLPLPFRR